MLHFLVILISVPFSSSQYNFRVSENRSPNTFVGQILVKSDFKYDFYEKWDMFIFNKLNGNIHTKKIIDRESLDSYVVSLFVYEREGSVFIRTININVQITDENDNAPTFSPNNVRRTVVENTALMTEISIPLAFDNDSEEFGLRNNYWIESGNEDDRFRLTGVSDESRGALSLQVVRPLDREVRAQYNLTISVQDKGQPPLKGQLFVELIVDDYNDNSPVFSPSKYIVHVNETAPVGVTVVVVFASDADFGENNRVSYRFKKTKTTREGEFFIDPVSGRITTADRMACHLTQDRCLLIVEAFDHGMPSLSAFCYVTVAVLRVNSHAPRLTISYVQSQSNVAFIEVGKVIKRPLAIIHAYDDDKDINITVSIVSPTVRPIFKLYKTHDNFYLLRQIFQIDQDHPRSFTITLKAVDSGSPRQSSLTLVRIRVNDKNIHSPIFTRPLQRLSFMDNIPMNSFITKLHAIDVDLGLNGLVTYSIENGNINNVFHLSTSSGLLTLRRDLQFSKIAFYNLTIVGKDSGIHSLNSSMLLEIHVTKSKHMKAMFNSTYPRSLILDKAINEVHGYFVYDFDPDILVTDNIRREYVDLIILNSGYKSFNKVLFLEDICSIESSQTIALVLVYSSVELDKIFINISITPIIFSKICWSQPLIFIRKFPGTFSYNYLLYNLKKDIPFDGTFQQLSSLEQFSLNRDGEIFWRHPVLVTKPLLELKIIYYYEYTGIMLSRNVSVLFLNSSLETLFFDCSQWPTIFKNSNGTSGEKDPIIVIRPVDWTGKYVDLYKDTSKVFALNSQGWQSCDVELDKRKSCGFLRELYYFESKESEKGAKIGEISLRGFLNTSIFQVKLFGRDSSFFFLSDFSLFLKESFTRDNTVRVFKFYSVIFNKNNDAVLDKSEIFVEFISLYGSPHFKESSFTIVVPENATSHTPLHRVELTSSQSYLDFNFFVSQRPSSPQWAIFPDGSLYVLSPLDYEQTDQYDLEVVAVNKVVMVWRVTVPVKVFVEDINDHSPVFTREGYFFNVTISNCASNFVGQVMAVDGDSGLNGDVEYGIATPVSGMDMIQLDPYSGIINISGCMKELVERMHLEVVALDRGSPRRSTKVYVYITIDFVKAFKLEIVSNNYLEVSENETVGRIIGKVATNYGEEVRYAIKKSSDWTVFSVNTESGEIILRGVLDRETTREYIVVVVASMPLDRDIATKRIRIMVTDVNDNRPIFSGGSLTMITVPESLKVGSILGQYSATDHDEGHNGAVRYRFTTTKDSEESTIFRVDLFSGILYLNRGLDYEYKSLWRVNITAFDCGNPSLEGHLLVTVVVTNVNDNIPIFVDVTPEKFIIKNPVDQGGIVGQVKARDFDNNTIIYCIAYVDPPEHPFVMSPTSGIFSYVGSLPKENSYNVAIMAIDADKKQWFSIHNFSVIFKKKEIEDIHLFVYDAIILPSTLFADEKIASVTARSTYSDSKLRYRILSTSLSDLRMNSYTGELYLTSQCPLKLIIIDLRFSVQQRSSSITKATEVIHSTKLVRYQNHSDSLSFQKNEYVIYVPEDQTLRGSELVKLHALYPGNPISNLEYLITDIYIGISSRIRLPCTTISIDRDNGLLRVGTEDLDREVIDGSQIIVEVLVVDRGNNASRMSITKVYINILDRNDNRPVFTKVTYVFHVPENVSRSHRLMIGQVQAHDRDLEAVLVYDWLSGDHSYFSLDNYTGIITTSGVPLDYEAVQSMRLAISVSDGRFSSTADVIIVVDDVNEYGPKFSNETYHVWCKENIPQHTVIGQVRAEDQDGEKDSPVRYSLISGWGSSLFAVDSRHGIISSSAAIDYEQGSHYLLLVTATTDTTSSRQTQISSSSGVASESVATATVVVLVLNDNDNKPLFDYRDVNISIAEDTAIGNRVTQVSASDQDEDDILQYEIVSSNDHIFAIDPLNGTIVLLTRLDYEENPSHEIVVRCTDGQFSSTAVVHVHVININDSPPVIHNPSRMLINRRYPTKSHFIYCTDDDHLNPLQYDLKSTSLSTNKVSVDAATGEIFHLLDNRTSSVLVAELLCSDPRYTVSKNVTFLFVDDLPRPITASISLSILSLDQTISLPSLTLRQYQNFFLQPGVYRDQFTGDWVLFVIDPVTGDLRTRPGFEPTNRQYKLRVVDLPLNPHNHPLYVDVTIDYIRLDLCRPRFIGTPYEFHVYYPITETRQIGAAKLQYCPGHSVEYYLSSGHSYFNINITSGHILAYQTPPSGHYKYKLTAVIQGPFKRYLSTEFSVMTTLSSTDPVHCQLTVLRLVANSTDRPGTVLGRIFITGMSKDSKLRSYYVHGVFPFNVDTSGAIYVSGNLSQRAGMTFNFSVSISWSSQSAMDNSIKCLVAVEVLEVSSRCTLSLTYPEAAIEMKTTANSAAESFLFSLPVSHGPCRRSNHTITFTLTDHTHIKVHPRSGDLTSRAPLSEGQYPLSVLVSSSDSINILRIPLIIYVLPSFADVTISCGSTMVTYEIQGDLAEGMGIGQIVCNVDPVALLPRLRYSIVSFCCQCPSNIAVYRNSIHQSPFKLDKLSGKITLHARPSPNINVYQIVIRASVSSTSPPGYRYEDVSVRINVLNPPCSCTRRFFNVTVLEGSVNGEVVVNNVLMCTSKTAISESVEPASLQKYLLYDKSLNALVTTKEPLDYEKDNVLEVDVVVKIEGQVILRCQGVVHIADTNDNAPRFLRNYYIGTIEENSPINTWIVNVEVSDLDSSKFQLDFSLSGDGFENFRIDPHNGSVFSAAELDREKRDRYNLKVKVTDGVHALETGMLITVQDVNDNSPQISSLVANTTIVINRRALQNGKDVPIVTISSTDADDRRSNNSQVFCALDSSSSGVLTRRIISLNGTTCQVTVLNRYISLIPDNHTLSLVVIVSDHGVPTLLNITTLRIVFVEDVDQIRISERNYRQPIAVLQSTLIHTNILSMEVWNKNLFRDLIFIVDHGNGSFLFGVNENSGMVYTRTSLKTSTVGTKYSLTIHVCGARIDASIRQCSDSVLVYFVITDFNLYSPEITVDPPSVTVTEDIQIGTKLARVRISDKDDGVSGLFEMCLKGPSRSLFSVLQTSDKLTFHLVTNESLDYETLIEHRIFIVVNDLGSPKRTQTTIFMVNLIDIDDNAPYFVHKHVIVNLPNVSTPISLPLAIDDDRTLIFRENVFSVTPGGLVQLQHSQGHLQAQIERSHMNVSFMQFSLQVSGGRPSARCVRCSTMEVYVIIAKEHAVRIDCPAIIPMIHPQQSNNLQYHILMIAPPSSDTRYRELVFAVSRHTTLGVQFQVCRHRNKDLNFITPTIYKLRLTNILVTNDIEKGREVGRISVLLHGVDVSKQFFFRLLSDGFSPFIFLNGGESIVATRLVTVNIYTIYNVTVIARKMCNHSVSEPLTGQLQIVVGSEEIPIMNMSVSIRIREGSGNGRTIGNIYTILTKPRTQQFVLEGDAGGLITMDNNGVIRIMGNVDREKKDEVRVRVSSKETTVTMSMTIEDENDNDSIGRKSTIIIEVDEDTANIGRVVRVTPLDGDIVGEYQCRLYSLEAPQGVLLTPDCWLYIIDHKVISNTSIMIPVVHHDGVHPGVKSIFSLDIERRSFNNKYNDWVLLIVPSFQLDTILPRLRFLRAFFHSIQMGPVVVGLNPEQRYIIVRGIDRQGHALASKLASHKTRIEEILQSQSIEILFEVCHVDSCHFHGECKSVVHTRYETMFQDDDQLPRGSIYVYPTMTVTKVCTCQQGFIGPSCNISVNCPHQVCHNGGVCGQDGLGGTVCLCPPGFYGDRCDQDVNECLHGDLCGINGKCVNILGSYKCECHLEWSGTSHCKTPFNQCLSSQCSTSGTQQCIPTVGGFLCRCEFGHYGDKCTLSSVSFTAQSSIMWRLLYIGVVSLEFATISHEADLLEVVLISTLKIQVSISLGKIRLLLSNQNHVIGYRQSSINVSSGSWIKMILEVSTDSLRLQVVKCGELCDCEKSSTIYGGSRPLSDTLEIQSTLALPQRLVSIVLGNEVTSKTGHSAFFVGCVRNINFHNSSVISKKDVDIRYDGCPRFKNGVAPCGNAAEKCGRVGDCVDEWLDSRCICPDGYQPPSCSPGYEAVSVATNTIVAFVQRPEYRGKFLVRQKREISNTVSEISLRIKTRHADSILLLSFSSLHTFTLIQIHSGMIKIVDKFAGSIQEISHRALVVNDNSVHTVTFTRSSSTGRISVTVDSVVAIVEWLQSHDPLGTSVQTIYVAGVPQADRTQELNNIPNFLGCLSEVRFNNRSQPLTGITDRFNVSVVQGLLTSGCESGACTRKGVCGKYQRCREMHGLPHSHWGQYQCLSNDGHRLLAILTPVLVCILVCVCLLVLIICMMQRRTRLMKAKAEISGTETRFKNNKKYGIRSSAGQDTLTILPSQNTDKTSRTRTPGTLLPSDMDQGVSCRPDLIPSQNGFFSPPWMSSQPYYQDSCMSNSYISTGPLFKRQTSGGPMVSKHQNPRYLSASHNVLRGADDGLVFRCSHPDLYEAMGSQQSSDSQETIKRPKFRHIQKHSKQKSYPDRLLQSNDSMPLTHLQKPGLSSSSSNGSQFLMPTVQPKSYAFEDIFSNNDSTVTASIQVEETEDSLSSRGSGGPNVFTPTNSSDSVASNQNLSSCRRIIQRALPPPPPALPIPLQSEDQYEYADVKTINRNL